VEEDDGDGDLGDFGLSKLRLISVISLDFFLAFS
jgi:hypothetical protein